MRRRAAVEGVIGHFKPENRFDGSDHKGCDGNRANDVLTVFRHRLKLVLK